MLKHRWSATAVGVASLLAGCASFSQDAGMDAVTRIVADAHKIDSEEVSTAAGARLRTLLGSPLSAGTAVRIALLNNKGLQASYNELGIAEATKIEASLPPNPTFIVRGTSTPVELDIEREVAADVLALVTLPARSSIAADRFHQAQLQAANETLHLAAEARRNFYRAVASRQLVGFLRQAVTAAETAAKLAGELGDTGAMSKLDVAREQTFHIELAAQLTAAQQRAESDRENLIRSLGLSGSDDGLKLPTVLPALPKRPKTLPAVEAEAVRRRVDVQIARVEIDALARSYGLTQATRFVNLLEVSGISRTQNEGGRNRGTGGGAAIEFQVPVFDFGEVRLHQAREAYRAALNRLADKVVNVRSQARDAYLRYRSAYDIALKYRDQVLPLRNLIRDETTLQYGAMQIDVFSLLTEARQGLAANLTAIEAQRDFWVASTNLDAAIIGGGELAPPSDSAVN